MSFQPVLPLTGYVGWRFLQRTLESQQETFKSSEPVQRSTDYFREKIGAIRTAEDLVGDRRLLDVALGAFGLEDDIDNRYFIQKILSDGTQGSDALSNRLSDKRYLAFSEAFGFGDSALPKTQTIGFADRVTALYEKRQFERAVGDQNSNMRAALSLSDNLSDITDSVKSKKAQWFAVMGNPPLRTVFETALGLPASIAQIDLDQQYDSFTRRAEATFGTSDVATIAEADNQEKLIRLFLIRSESAGLSGNSGQAIALNLLQSMPRVFAPL